MSATGSARGRFFPFAVLHGLIGQRSVFRLRHGLANERGIRRGVPRGKLPGAFKIARVGDHGGELPGPVKSVHRRSGDRLGEETKVDPDGNSHRGRALASRREGRPQKRKPARCRAGLSRRELGNQAAFARLRRRTKAKMANAEIAMANVLGSGTAVASTEKT